jgi:hypothetical protein
MIELPLFKYYFTVSLYFFFFITAAQEQVADSLVKIYQEGNLDNAEKLELLRNLSLMKYNLRLSLKYAEELIALSRIEKTIYICIEAIFKRNKLRLLENLIKLGFFSRVKGSIKS